MHRHHSYMQLGHGEALSFPVLEGVLVSLSIIKASQDDKRIEVVVVVALKV